MELNIYHLYPDVLNLYGDRGNVLCMQRRLEWRGMQANIVNVPIGTKLDAKNCDLIFIGGGQDFEQEVLLDDLKGEKTAELKAAIEAVKKDPKALARWGGSVPKNLKLPLRDGDTEKDDENYEGCYFLNANASENRRPKIIDRACNDVLDQDEVYSGCYANVKIGLFSYSASGNKGIGAGLEVIQKVRDGERLSGGNSTDGFEVLSDDDDSFLD